MGLAIELRSPVLLFFPADFIWGSRIVYYISTLAMERNRHAVFVLKKEHNTVITVTRDVGYNP